MATTSSVQFDASAVPDEQELLRRAREMGPRLRERARKCEEMRRVPDETVAEFEEAGFYRILQPKAHGGYEMWPSVFYNVVVEVAKHCAASAWTLSILGIHNWEAGLTDSRFGDDLWKTDQNTRFSSSYAPFGKARRVEGGFEVEGNWPWSSGCDQATWVILGALIDNEQGGKDHVALLVAPGDYRIDQDSWHSIGLSGTGSKNIIVNGAFVPEYRIHNISESFHFRDPGRKDNTAPTYKLPFGSVFAFTLASPVIGIAEAALEYYVEYIRRRTNAYTGASFKEEHIPQQILADAHSLIDSARLKLKRDMEEMAEFTARGERVPLERRVFYKWDAAAIAKYCRDAVNMLVHACGGTVFDRDNPMQRYFRDINVAGNHLYLSHQKGSVNYGGFVISGINNDGMV